MKIIEEHKGKRLKCENCQSILEYLEKDINYEPTSYHDSDKYVLCPVCEYKNYISK